MKIPTAFKRWSPLFALVLVGCLFQFRSVLALTQWFKKSETPIQEWVSSAENLIQVALLLDTSSSMEGLIEQAKSQLWQILNNLSEAERNGAGPKIEIALYHYGNTEISEASGYVKQLLPFTSDVDAVSEALFRLRTNGGEEYCGMAIKTALDNLEWSAGEDQLRLLFIAGNEGFDQGPVSFQKICRKAKDQGIVVNTIFCGESLQGIQMGWQQGALIAGGHYANINQNLATDFIETPYDEEISRLNLRLNSTYIPFGKLGLNKQKNQQAQDANAFSYSVANAASRACFKASSNYVNTSWDLVDAFEADSTVLQKQLELAKEYQNLSRNHLRLKIKECQDKRSAISQQIQALNQNRQGFIQQQLAASPTLDTESLEVSFMQSLEDIAKTKGFELK
ncbi:MAG: VWA domain-containing protein [Saprospiraceae bacterium]|nr:VWA domain-containing protein [Saprospiraceae bacterium]